MRGCGLWGVPMSYIEKLDGAAGSALEIGAAAAAAVTGLGAEAQIRVPGGVRRAEFLRPGDLVVTRDHGHQPVRMIFTTTIDPVEMQADPSLAPVRLGPRAVGPMMPQRSVTMAPGQGVLVPGYLVQGHDADGALVPARDVTGYTEGSFMDRNAEPLFYNLVFDRHEVIWASGLPVESFHATPASLGPLEPATRDALVLRFPPLRGKQEAFPQMRFPRAEPGAYMPPQA